MNTPTLTSSHLQLLLDLTRRKEAIAADLEQLERRIASLYDGKHVDAEATTPKVGRRRGRPPGKKPKAAPVAKSGKKRTTRGSLKEKVLEVLRSAGGEGLAVGDVADKIGAKKAAVNVWFYTTGKKIEGLKKIAPGRFALKS